MSKRRLTMLKPRIKLLAPRVLGEQTARAGYRKRERARRALFQRNPLCVGCSTAEHPVVATQADHIVPLWKGGPDDTANLQGLCDSCHAKKSRLEDAERARGA